MTTLEIGGGELGGCEIGCNRFPMAAKPASFVKPMTNEQEVPWDDNQTATYLLLLRTAKLKFQLFW